MGNDVEGVVKAYERQDVETCHVLDGIFIFYALAELPVLAHLVAQVYDLLNKLWLLLGKLFLALLVASVEHGSVGQHNACREKHLVAVGVCAAVHARCVVHDDAAHHGALYRCRVWSKLSAIRTQQIVDTLADDAWLQAYLHAVVENVIFLPVLAGDDKDRVADGLSRQTGAGGAEGDRQMLRLCKRQQL